MTTDVLRVCFVCTGNICRSPTAEWILRAMVAEAGLAELVTVDSAGTHGWHAGDDMDARSRRVLRSSGYDPGRHRAKQFRVDMFAERDLVVALDDGHLAVLANLAHRTPDPGSAHESIVLLRTFDQGALVDGALEVPDPYYGGPDEFLDVLQMIERACEGLVSNLRARLRPA